MKQMDKAEKELTPTRQCQEGFIQINMKFHSISLYLDQDLLWSPGHRLCIESKLRQESILIFVLAMVRYVSFSDSVE